MNHNFVRLFALLFPLLFLGGASAADSQAFVELKQIADGFTSPLNLLTLDDGSGRLLIGDQIGVIRILNKDGKIAENPFADLRMVTLKPSGEAAPKVVAASLWDARLQKGLLVVDRLPPLPQPERSGKVAGMHG